MKTSLNISTISYNTDEFLDLKLDELLRGKVISYYMYINHINENDECNKDHKHLFIIPSHSLQSDELRLQFLEPDPENPIPRKVLPFEFSKVDDWLLYAIHDKHYLALKGQTRIYHYKWENIKSSDEDYKNVLIKRINVDITPYDKIQSAQATGQNFYEFVTSGQVPIRDINYYEKAWTAFNMISEQKDELNRNGKKNHEDHTGVCTQCKNNFDISEMVEVYTDFKGVMRGICKECKSKMSDK